MKTILLAASAAAFFGTAYEIGGSYVYPGPAPRAAATASVAAADPVVLAHDVTLHELPFYDDDLLPAPPDASRD